MYLSTPVVVAWVFLTLSVLLFAVRVQRQQRRNLSLLRQTKRTLDKLESKNGKLWREVLKNRADGEYRSAEVTLTNVNDI